MKDAKVLFWLTFKYLKQIFEASELHVKIYFDDNFSSMYSTLRAC